MRALSLITGAVCTITAAGVAQADVKMSPIEAYTIEYEMTGMQEGTVVSHMRDYGRETVQITDAVMNFMGMNQQQKSRTIMKGRNITTVDLTTNTVTTIENPMYDDIQAALKDKSAEELGEEMIRAMGGTPTGESGSFAGMGCDYWTIEQFGQKMCLADKGIVLRIEMNMGGVNMVQTATSVDRGNPGPDSAYEVPANAKPQQIPANVQELMQQFGQ